MKYISILFFTLFLSTLSVAQTWKSPTQIGGNYFNSIDTPLFFSPPNLNSIKMIDDNNGWVVGNTGLIAKTSDKGVTWKDQISNTQDNLLECTFKSPSIGFAIGERGSVIRTSNGGNTWEQASPVITTGLNNIFFINTQIGWIVGNNKVIKKTINGGSTWITQSTGLSTNYTGSLKTVFFIDENTGWAGTTAEKILLKTVNGGTTWSRMNDTPTPFVNIFFIDQNNGWAVGDNVYKTIDGGITWIVVSGAFDGGLKKVYFNDANNGYIAGVSSLYRTINGGLSWIKQNYSGVLGATTMSVIGTEHIWFAGPNGSIASTIDGGNSWIKLTALTTSSLKDIFFIDNNIGWAVGSSFMKTIDGGLHWTAQLSGSYPLNSVFFIDANNGWSVGDYNTIRRTVNGGQTWESNSCCASRTYRDVFFSNPNKGFAVGGEGVSGYIVKSIDGGKNWSDLFTAPSKPLRAIYLNNENLGWVVGDGGNIYKTVNGGNSWQYVNSGTNKDLYDVYFFSETNGLIVGRGGTILRTSNGGLSWEIYSANTTDDFIKIYSINSSNLWLLSSNVSNSSKSKIYNTKDGGLNWNSYDFSPKLNSIHSSIGGNITVVGEGGFIYLLSGMRVFSDEIGIKDNVKIYPNPNRGEFIIDILDIDTEGKIEIVNLMGEIIFTQKVNANSKHYKIDLHKLPNGIYFNKLNYGKKKIIEKLIIQK